MEISTEFEGKPRWGLHQENFSLFFEKGVDEKLISPVEKNMTWQISSSEMFPHETERLSFRTVREIRFREISLEPLRSLNPLPLFDVCSRIFRNMTLHYSETEKGKTPC